MHACLKHSTWYFIPFPVLITSCNYKNCIVVSSCQFNIIMLYWTRRLRYHTSLLPRPLLGWLSPQPESCWRFWRLLLTGSASVCTRRSSSEPGTRLVRLVHKTHVWKIFTTKFQLFKFRGLYFRVSVVGHENRENLELAKISRYTVPMMEGTECRKE